MTTFRFNWNPTAWTWTDLPARLAELAKTGTTTTRWSTGGSKQPQIGDRAILLRVGVPPRGIVGIGTILAAPHASPHWDPEHAAQGKTMTCVDICFSRLAPEPFLPVAQIEPLLPDDVKLFTQSPCIVVPEEVADRLLDQC